ncbi:YybH family protein [Muriicola sp. Z0-33]|uniref:YybH family protein n=1 Tax=Muriicola sp. Z0-33 TaxID=2816957 RepID=UPI0022372823|nr:nuclear transport factor 2 family protein [Muriicola sp. Z0-33]MCW5514870.1 nuclear transport factor 2 family protein [Muriicola sp. Z0-33]
MKNILLTLMTCSMITFTVCSQEEVETIEKNAIISIMMQQQKDWSNGDLEGFMEGYWKSDSLKYFGSKGISLGWQNTLDNYKKGYPTKADTGTLKFKIEDISKIGEGSYFVMGRYHLSREIGDANGVFMIIFKKINGLWKIIADMSC